MESATELTPRQCWDLLASADVGRLAVCLGEGPEIFPVNYVVAAGSVVFRTAAGLKHVAIRLGQSVAFEVDGVDSATDTAWSVVVKGRGHDLSDPTEVEFARSLALAPLQPDRKEYFVRVEPEAVTGRRFAVAPIERWLEPDGRATTC